MAATRVARIRPSSSCVRSPRVRPSCAPRPAFPPRGPSQAFPPLADRAVWAPPARAGTHCGAPRRRSRPRALFGVGPVGQNLLLTRHGNCPILHEGRRWVAGALASLAHRTKPIVTAAHAAVLTPQKSKNLAQNGLAFRRQRSVTESAGADCVPGSSPAGPIVWAGLGSCGGTTSR